MLKIKNSLKKIFIKIYYHFSATVLSIKKMCAYVIRKTNNLQFTMIVSCSSYPRLNITMMLRSTFTFTEYRIRNITYIGVLETDRKVCEHLLLFF